MTSKTKELLADAMQLPAEERVALADSLLESLEIGDPEAEAEFQKEIEARLAELESNKVQPIPSSAVRRREITSTFQPASKTVSVLTGRIGSAAIVLSCLYLPFAWLLTMDYPWDSNRLSWFMLWPVLPGILPAMWLAHPYRLLAFAVAAIFTALLLIGLILLARRGTVWLVVAAILALAIAIPSSGMAYAVFRF